MFYAAVFIRSESADYYNLLVPFKTAEDFEQVLLERVFESPCYWSEYMVETNAGENMDKDLLETISNLIEDCLKDQEDEFEQD